VPATTVVMPKMGYDMTEGKIVRWLKHEGDSVQKGEPIAEIETDKVNIQIEAFTSGKLQKILASEGESVPVGQPIAQVGEPGEKPSEEAPSETLSTEEEGAGEGGESLPVGVTAMEPRMEPKPAQPPPAIEEERIKASPVARRLAQEQGIELSQVQGSGPGGRITKEDVERFLTEAVRRQGVPEKMAAPPKVAEKPSPPPTAEVREAAAPQPPAPQPKAAAPTAPPLGIPAEVKELSRMGQAIARHMAESMRTAPHFYVTIEIDMSRVVAMREELNKDVPKEERISINDFVMKATAQALTKHPKMNASYTDGKLALYKQINLGMAVAVEEGLIAPVIRECDKKSLMQIAMESRDLVARTREGKLRPEDYSDGTFTVSNMGMLGVEEFTAIINPPQAAIMAVGTVALRPVVQEEILTTAYTMKATLSVDHRVANGADAARFLTEVKSWLESPSRLLL
jgi:pyruvate dehydrogenase E2 component (dihydrolipoamide acetyltransferase)